MLKTRHLFFILIPAVLVAGLALFIRVIQYEPLIPKVDTNQPQTIVSQIPIFPEDPIEGNKKNPTTLMVFSDMACTHCADQDKILNKLLAKYPNKIKIITKLLPVNILPQPSRPANKYAFCANEQNKYLEFKTMAFANVNDLTDSTLIVIAKEIKLDEEKLSSCLASARPENYLKKNEELAKLLNLQAVPVYFLNNNQVPSQTTLENWETLLSL